MVNRDDRTEPSTASGPFIIVPPGWRLPERMATPEDLYLNRRRFLQGLGAIGLGAMGLTAGCMPPDSRAQSASGETTAASTSPEDLTAGGLYPARRNPEFTLDRPLTDEAVAARYNNFYEFTTDKERVAQLAEQFTTRPWQVEVTGLVERPMTFDVDELERAMPLEERLCRHRCVEAWAMAVPWTGFPLHALMDRVQPTSAARFVRFISFMRPSQAPGQRTQTWYPWPYHEGLSMAEARNELTLVVTGIYGHRLPPQHGAPIRIVTPWKYGYKSIKSIVRIEFVADQPATFWNEVAPDEYGFVSNVDPAVPHPRWSQATERMIGTGERLPTQIYNGYGRWVAGLYA
jgi:sulfoxide reductase catalytic subunit YedY